MPSFRTAAAVAALALAACATGARAQSFVEYDSQWDLQMIGVQAAYDRGYTGKGVVVGVVDSGANVNHVDLIGNLTPYSLDIFTGGPVTEDPQGHGSHVAGTIGAARNGIGSQGVAYDVQLTILRLLDENNAASGPNTAIATLLNYGLDHDVRIFNNSWGGLFIVPEAEPWEIAQHFGPEVMGAYQRAVDLDSILVWATGNETLDQPGIQAGLPYYFPEWREHWLAVTAVGSNGLLAPYANKCGLAASWCLAAPGGAAALPGQTLYDAYIWSTDNTDNQGTNGQGGTSMAAPHVTGALAIARQMFPKAPAAGLTRLVLATATDKGAPGVDEDYGWGLLNVANMAVTLDPQAGSVFANGVWAADAGQRALFEALDGRMAGETAAGAWATVLAGRSEHDATGSSLASEADTYGAAFGYDIAARGVLLGVSLSQTRTTAEEARGANKAEVEALGVSVYARAERGALFIEAAGGVEMRDFDFTRRDILGSSGTVLAGAGIVGRAETDGLGVFARGRLGMTFETGPVELRPFVHARASYQRIGAFREEGADVFSQNADDAGLTLYEAGPGVEAVVAPRPVGKAEVGGALALRYDMRWGDDEFATPTKMLGSPIPAAAGELDDAVTVAARVNAAVGGWDIGARGWWSGGGNTQAAGVGLGVRLAF